MRKSKTHDFSDVSDVSIEKYPIKIECDFRINNEVLKTHEHTCNAILIAEDNKNILKR